MVPPFWINNIDKEGRVIDDAFIKIAENMWPQAVSSTKKWLGDSSPAAEIMEAAVHLVWAKFLRGGIKAIDKCDSYLRKAFYRLLKYFALKQGAIILKPPSILRIHLETCKNHVCLDKNGVIVDYYPIQKEELLALLTALQLEQFLEQLNEEERNLVVLHYLEEYDWKYISSYYSKSRQED